MENPAAEDEVRFGLSERRPRILPLSPGGRIMDQLSREDCIELGLSVPTIPLVAWAHEQLSVAKGRQERLGGRGVTEPFLKEIKNLIGRIGELEKALGREHSRLSEEAAFSQGLREEASAYLQEVHQLFKIEFGTRPDIQVRSRPGVRTGRLLANLRREMEYVVGALREHSPQLAWLGVDEDFINAGEMLIGALKEAQEELHSACTGLSPALAEQCCEKGKLYDLCRKLVRIGKLEFIQEPEQAAAFNYAQLRRDLRPASEIRGKTAKAVGR
jgi:hypothetical protein